MSRRIEISLTSCSMYCILIMSINYCVPYSLPFTKLVNSSYETSYNSIQYVDHIFFMKSILNVMFILYAICNNIN